MTYSDTSCPSGPAPAGTAKPNQALPNKVSGGKLTEAAVEKVLRHAARLAMASDYQGQCALAARDLSFELTDRSGARPEVISGGRSEICAAQRESAQAMEQNRVTPAVRLGKISISLNADASRATARYESVTTFSQQGQVVLAIHCAREDVLGLYAGEILYSRVTATCKPES